MTIKHNFIKDQHNQITKLKERAQYLTAKRLVLQTTKHLIFGKRQETSIFSGNTLEFEEFIDQTKDKNSEVGAV